MFDISGNDIAILSDVDLRSLVARLALAELRAKGYPRSSVTAGGNQDAADGGLDVRVECPSDIKDPDFVPRRLTGFQVKKPDMQPSAIRDEMRPKGVLREVINCLKHAHGNGANERDNPKRLARSLEKFNPPIEQIDVFAIALVPR